MIIPCNDEGTKGGSGEDTTASSQPAQQKVENLSFQSDTVSMNGYLVYKDSGGRKPAVIVIHEWWGLNDYAKDRARQLSDLGYVALAADMFGNGRTGNNPDEAMKLAGPFYQDPSLTKKRIDAALAQLKMHPQVDSTRIAAIGYCFGGYTVLNAAKLGADLDGVVSFHGNLGGAAPVKDAMKAKVLVLHGEADNLVPAAEQEQFRKQMDSVDADYTFKTYPGAKHAFTNPGATENGRKFGLPIEYNAEADKASWNEMKEFLRGLFGR
jgi:dienelactone hydrolase